MKRKLLLCEVRLRKTLIMQSSLEIRNADKETNILPSTRVNAVTFVMQQYLTESFLFSLVNMLFTENV